MGSGETDVIYMSGGGKEGCHGGREGGGEVGKRTPWRENCLRIREGGKKPQDLMVNYIMKTVPYL